MFSTFSPLLGMMVGMMAHVQQPQALLKTFKRSYQGLLTQIKGTAGIKTERSPYLKRNITMNSSSCFHGRIAI